MCHLKTLSSFVSADKTSKNVAFVMQLGSLRGFSRRYGLKSY